MAPIKISSVVSCSSEDKSACASNLLASDSFKKWATDKPGLLKASVILQLECEQQITGLDIGNNGSAFVEVLVANSASTVGDAGYENLIITSSFMSPSESRSQTNRHKMRMFSRADLVKQTAEKKWDRLKIICTQPYNKIAPYGLSVVTVQGVKQHVLKKAEPAKIAAEALTLLKEAKQKRTNDEGGSAPHKTKKSEGASSSSSNSSSVETQESKAASSLLSTLQQTTTSRDALERLKTSGDKKIAPLPAAVRTYLTKSVIDIADDGEASRDLLQPITALYSGSRTKPSRAAVTSPKQTTAVTSPKQTTSDFSKLLDGAVFVLSGFQNPLRRDIREIGLSMGGSYRPDWCSEATHLICAVPNTPKYNQVKGKGIIVRKEWLLDCKRTRRRLPEKKFRLDLKSSQSSTDEEEEEKEKEEEEEEEEESKGAGGVNMVSNKRKHSKGIVYTEEDSEDEIKEETLSEKRRKKEKQKKEEKDEEEFIPSVTISSDEEEEEIEEFEDSEEEKIAKISDDEDISDQDTRVGHTKEEVLVNHQLPDISDSEDEAVTGDPFEVETDEETEGDVIRRLNLPPLPDIFTGHTFYLHSDSLEREQIKQLNRYMIGYGGKVYEHMSPKVKFIVTSSASWQSDFQQAVATNPRVRFLRSSWVIESSNELKCLNKTGYYISQ